MLGWNRRPTRQWSNRTLQALLLWVAFGVVAVGVHGWVASPDARAQAPERGETRSSPARMGELIWDRDCASCHGPEGDGTRWGPNLQGKGPASVHLMVTTGRMPIEDLQYLRDRPPGEDDLQVPRTHDRAGEYLPGQVSALVAYSRSIIDGPDVPVVDVASADVSRGGELFQANCASCHSWSTRGGALANGHHAPSLVESTPVQVVEAMRTGIGTMPEFPPSLFTDEEAADMAAYVAYMHHPRNSGGNPLNYLGPAAEGLAAGVFGILGLLLLVRWIGSRWQ